MVFRAGYRPQDYHNHPEASQKAEQLCKRFGIWYLFPPGAKIPQRWGGNYFTLEDEIVAVLYPTKYRGLSEDERKTGKKYKYLPIPVFEEGEVLIIKINLHEDKENILDIISERKI